MNAIRQIILNNSTPKKVWVLFGITQLIYGAMLLFTLPMIKQYAGGMAPLDLMPLGYDATYVTTLFKALGEPGRSAYLFWQLPIDMVYPLFFAVSYALLMAYLLRKMDRLQGSWFYLCLLPLVSGMFDYLENIGISMLLRSFPNISDSLVALTSGFTLLKSITTTIYFLCLVACLLVWGYRVFNKIR